MTDERAAKVAEVLRDAAETHHRVFAITDGADEDWASWYSALLIDLSALPTILGVTPVRSELTYLLVRLGKEDDAFGERWEDRYARALVRHFPRGASPA